MKKLLDIGGGANEPERERFNLEALNKGWNQSKAGFKFEGQQTTIHLGTGAALNIFNENIVVWNKLKKREQVITT